MRSVMLVRRVAYRVALRLRRQWRTTLGMVGALAAIVAFNASTAPLLAPLADAAGVPDAVAGDCADRTMAAVLGRTRTLAQAAYRCLSPSLAQTVSEDQFVGQLTEQAGAPPDTRVARVANFHAPSGEQIVYFALTTRTQAVAYVVYLDPTGRVARIE